MRQEVFVAAAKVDGTEQIELEPANESTAVRLGVRLKTFALQLGQHQRINGVLNFEL